ncbi:MAG: extracellular solute-binding protein [Intrasporangium sp.]|uniref:extracellular solute-binding protein n=1 Tax=Intrasporangium sp. TaxID=1925024 RepID=UPI003F7F5FC6
MGSSNRRHRTVAVLAALAAASGLALSACGSSSAGSGPPVLTWYINPDGGGSDPTKGGQAQLAKECTDASQGRYSIKIQLLPNSASDQRQQLLRRLAAKDTGTDLMSMDPVFVAEFAQAGFLDPVPAADADTFTRNAVKPSVEASTWKGKLIAAPMWANTQLLWYRKSVAKAAGLDMNQPVTWSQVIEAAKSQNKTIGVQAKRYEGYMVWINALVAGAGGQIIENPGASGDQLRFGLDSPSGQAAAAVIQKVAQQGVAGPAMGSLDETAALDLFSSEATSGFLVNWPYVWAALPGNKVPFIDDVGWARYPQTVQGQPSRPPFGGIELGVNAVSPHKAEAWDAIKCITTPAHQKLYMLGTGNPAADKTVYDDPEIKKQFPMAELIRESLDAAAPRPLTQYYGDVSSAIQRVFSPPSSVDPNTTPRDAANLISAVLKGDALL